jgi:AraC-like DNA-binding protein
MDLGNKLLFFFSSLGAFNGFVLGIYFIFFTAKKHLSNIFLGALLLALSIRIGKSVAFFFDYNVPRTILQIGLTACTFIGPFLYFFLKSELNQTRKLPASWKMQLVGWFILVTGVGIIYPYENFPQTWGHVIIPVIYSQWGVYVALSIVSLVPVLKKIFRKQKVKPFENWMLGICGGVTLIFIAYAWAFMGITKGSYITGPIYFSLIIYLIVFVLLYRKKTNDLSSFSSLKNPDKKLQEEDAQLLLGRLQKAMTEKELFKNPNLKVNDVAREINISGHQLSQLLNNNLSKNFTLFVNEYRVNEACKMLMEDNNLTIDAISFEVGFNSKSTFFATFKKLKGLTPSAFQQSATPDL